MGIAVFFLVIGCSEDESPNTGMDPGTTQGDTASDFSLIDVNPNSGELNQHIQTISLEAPKVPFGLRGAAIDPSGQRLFVAAPNRTLVGAPELDFGHIMVVNIDPASKSSGRSSSRRWPCRRPRSGPARHPG